MSRRVSSLSFLRTPRHYATHPLSSTRCYRLRALEQAGFHTGLTRWEERREGYGLRDGSTTSEEGLRSAGDVDGQPSVPPPSDSLSDSSLSSTTPSTQSDASSSSSSSTSPPSDSPDPSPSPSQSTSHSSTSTPSSPDPSPPPPHPHVSFTTPHDLAELRSQLAHWTSRASLLARQSADDLTSRTKTRFSELGRYLNTVTGYDEIEALKAKVVEQEAKIAHTRSLARTAKQSHEHALSQLHASQRALTDLLHRKPTWSTTDVSTFTTLVQQDHTLSLSLSSTKHHLSLAEAQVDKEFSELMRLILGRYHEEQVWSDKIRSAATYGQWVVVVVNVVVFLGAVGVVEPWRRRRLVEGFEGTVGEMGREGEERVGGMVEGVREEVRRGLEEVRGEVRKLREAASSKAAVAPLVLESGESESSNVPPSPSTPHPTQRRLLHRAQSIFIHTLDPDTELALVISSTAALALAAGWIARTLI